MLFTPKEKGQGLIEYALIIILVAVVVIVVLLALTPIIVTIFCKIGSNLSASCNDEGGGSVGPLTNSVAKLIYVVGTPMLIVGLPVALSFLASFLDSTFKVVKGKLTLTKRGVFSSRICFSGISAELVGLSIIVQNRITDLLSYYIIFVIINIVLFSLCVRKIQPPWLRVSECVNDLRH